MGTRVSIPRLTQAAKRLRRNVLQVADELADQYITDVTDNLRVGLKPDGTSQPANKQTTLDSKRRKSQGSTPGVADRVMSNPAAWRKTRRDPTHIDIHVPAERADVVEYLRPLGYEFEGLTPQTLGRVSPALSKAAKDAFSRIDREEVS